MTSDLKAEPQLRDVLCCRGTKAYYHGGNRRFRALVDSHTSRYAEAASNKILKSQIVHSIIKEITSEGGSFLTKSKGGWKSISMKNAREKVGHALRRSIVESSTPKGKISLQDSSNIPTVLFNNIPNEIEPYTKVKESTCSIGPCYADSNLMPSSLPTTICDPTATNVAHNRPTQPQNNQGILKRNLYFESLCGSLGSKTEDDEIISFLARSTEKL